VRRSFILVYAVAAFIALTSQNDVRAQAWKMYADELKREANGEPASQPPLPSPSPAPDTTNETTEQNAGFLSFSDALGDDGSDYTGMAVDSEDEAERLAREESERFTAPPPSYRNFPERRSDARLNDVCFVSPSLGWAVGDCGTIWKTSDGGENWTLCATPSDANLFAVSFFDANYGLAVGGRVMATTRSGRGVVLRTIDGGVHWGEVETASFPILRDVRILDPENAWIAGDSSTMYPSGLFVSDDSGVSWNAVGGSKHSGWRTLMYDPIERLGAGVAMSGEIQTVEGDALARPAFSLGVRRLSDVCYDGAVGTAWIVGEQGLVLRSDDFGTNWSAVAGSFPNGVNDYFDLTAVASNGGFVATVGAPGSLFFRSDDGGQTWQASPTGIATPLRKLFFLDKQIGWAVGDFGTILATRDGGATWQIQRQGGSRTAILGVFGRAEDAPLEAFVQLALEEGYLSEIALMARETEYEQSSDEVGLVERLNEALVETGASGAIQAGIFQVAPKLRRDSLERILARFDAENDGSGRLRFRERLVRLLREWRPSVVVATDSALDDSSNAATLEVKGDFNSGNEANTIGLIDTLAQESQRVDQRPRDPFLDFILEELSGAIKDAADPTAFPEHLTLCKLEPWRVAKARLLCRAGTQGDMTIDDGYYCPSVGRTVGEIAAKARAILADNSDLVASTGFLTLFTDGTPENANKTFFDGLNLPYGSDARRLRSTAAAQNGEALVNRAGARRQKLGIAERLAKQATITPQSADLFIGSLRDNLVDVDSEFALEYIATSGKLFARIGAWRAAEEIYSNVPPSLFSNPESRPALAWLMQYYCGTEPTRRVQANGNVALDEDDGARLSNAKRLAETIRVEAPDAFMAPELRFPYAVVQLRTGDYQGAMRFYMNRSQISAGGTGAGGGTDDVWAVRAAAEYWLRAPQGDVGGLSEGPCPLCVAICRRAPEKPYLDGVLEPNVWDAAARLDLSTPYPEAPTREQTSDEKTRAQRRASNREFSQTLGTNVSFLVDSEYLYVAATCRKVQGIEYPKEKDKKAPRPRDAKLGARDRIEVAIDVDGDYTTAAKFVVDSRGWVADSLWNDATWNPKLFVAAAETDSEWTLEAAIPLASFTFESPRLGGVWRIAVRRVAPGVGVECWNVENSERGEDAFGLLRFE